MRPSGRFPSDLSRPDGSLAAGMLAADRARHMTSFKPWYFISIINEYDQSVVNPRTARTLYNEKDAFRVKHDTEKRAKQRRIITRHSPGQNIARNALI